MAVPVRPVVHDDYAAWRPLWDGYNAFYGRHADTALPEHITQATWQRFLDPDEPVFALVAEADGSVVGLAHYLFHRSVTKIEHVCYLSDLFTAPALRGQGIGRLLIEGCTLGPGLPVRRGSIGKPIKPTRPAAFSTTRWPGIWASSSIRTSFEPGGPSVAAGSAGRHPAQ